MTINVNLTDKQIKAIVQCIDRTRMDLEEYNKTNNKYQKDIIELEELRKYISKIRYETVSTNIENEGLKKFMRMQYGIE